MKPAETLHMYLRKTEYLRLCTETLERYGNRLMEFTAGAHCLYATKHPKAY